MLTRVKHGLNWAAILAAIACHSVLAEPGWCGWGILTSADGLADNRVSSILEDRSGNLWFGTNSGVSRYDGVTWQRFTTANGLAGNRVSTILEDRSGNLWFGTFGGGVSRYDGATWQTFRAAPDTLASNYVLSILEDRSGILWFGTDAGVSRYDGTTWQTFTTAEALAFSVVYCILEDRSGNLWFGTFSGVSRYDGATWRRFTTVNGLATNYVLSILEDRSGNLWFGTEDAGVSRYDGTSWRTFTTGDGLADNRVNSILEDRSGKLWFGTDGGVSRYDGTSWRTFRTADGLSDNRVTSILEDRSGNLWFGTNSGVSRYDGSTWRTFTNSDPARNYVNSILEDRSGKLWLATNGGVSRYDGATWQRFTDGYVYSALEDSSRNLWFGTNLGVSRYDGSNWQTFTRANGLIGDYVLSILEDRSGNLWFGTNSGVSRYDRAASAWQTFGTRDGLANNRVNSILEDRSGKLWFGTDGGVSRYDRAASTWQTFRAAPDTLAGNYVRSILEDQFGNLWFGTDAGVSRYDRAASTWQTFTTGDGLADSRVNSILEDRSGNLWFGTSGGGVTRYDGSTWRTFTTENGLADNTVSSILEDHSGDLWFGTSGGGVTRYEPDRVSPQTVLVSAPPRLSSSRNQKAVFAAAFGETGIEFSYQLDGMAWSAWSATNVWFRDDLVDGVHVFAVRSRDFLGNVDSTAAVDSFEIDATPPAPVISEPSFGQAVRGTIAIRGTVADARFTYYRVEALPSASDSWSDAALLAQSPSPASNGSLATWDTNSVADGLYDLRLSVTDSLGLIGRAQVTVLVDNHFPFAPETAPATIPAAQGGNLYTNGQELHLYFPPRAFPSDALVSLLPTGSAMDTLATGAVQVSPAYQIAWSAPLEKAATLGFSTQGLASGVLAVYQSSGGAAWERLGGAREPGALSLAITEPGYYAIFAETAPLEGAASLSELSFTPRVFSPAGTFANDQVAIGFTLGRSAPVTVRVYNRAGRLVREVSSGVTMGPGASLVRWDGRDRGGVYVADGLYLVTVEALGRIQRKTLAVVR